MPVKTFLAIFVTLLAYLVSRKLLPFPSLRPALKSSNMVAHTKAPAYFISHGGPPSMCSYRSTGPISP